MFFLGDLPTNIFCESTRIEIIQAEAKIKIPEEKIHRYIVAVSLAEAETLR
jgi:hypothetical protein